MAFAVHLLTFAQIDATGGGEIAAALHFGALVACGLMMATGKSGLTKSARSAFPAWLAALLVMAFAYMPINFMLMLRNAESASVMYQKGRYVLHNKRAVIRELSAGEAALHRVHEVRGISGHWIFFYLLPAAYFVARARGWQPPPAPHSK